MADGLEAIRRFLNEPQEAQTQERVGEVSRELVGPPAPKLDPPGQNESRRAIEEFLSQRRPLDAGEQMIQPLLGFVDSLGTRREALQGSSSAMAALGETPGVEFDIESGVSALDRALLNVTRSKEEQAAVLRRIPGVRDVGFNRFGDPIIRVNDPATGQPKDILANPAGLDPGDFMALMAEAPEVAFGMFAGRGIVKPGRGVLNSLKALFAMAAGSATGTATKETIVRTPLTPESEMGQLAKSIAMNAALSGGADLVGGVAMGGLTKAATKIVTPFGYERGVRQLDMARGAEILKADTGLDFFFTPAEITGSEALFKAESFAAQRVGSGKVFRRFLQQREDTITKLQNAMLGEDPSLIPSAAGVGRKVQETAGARLAPLDYAVSRETQGLLKAAEEDIAQSIGRATNVPLPVQQAAVGQAFFDRADKKLAEFKAASKARYADVYDNPALKDQGRNIDITPLSQDARKILDEVAAAEVERKKASPIRGVRGEEISTSETETEQFRSFVDQGVLRQLTELADAEGGRVGLRDLIELRHDVDDALFRGNRIQGLPERRLNQIREAITKRIQGGLDELDPSTELRQKWEAANQFYAAEIEKFKRAEINKIFRDPQQTGALGLHSVGERAVTNPDLFFAYRDFFGPDSQEYAQLKRLYADRIVLKASGLRTVDLNKFSARLEAAFENQPAIAEEVFGKEARNLQFFGKAGKAAVETLKTPTREVDVDELTRLIAPGGIPAPGNLTRDSLDNLISAQAKRAQELRNGLKAKIMRGNLDREGFNPSDFEQAFMDAEPRELSEVWSLLSDRPDLQQAVQQRVLLRFFQDVTTGNPASVRGSIIERIFDPKVPDTEKLRKNLTTLLGSDTIRLIKATGRVLAPGEEMQARFRASAGISVGQQQAGIQAAFMRPDQPLTAISAMDGLLRSMVLAATYTSRPGRAWVSNMVFAQTGATVADSIGLVNLGIASTPVMTALTEMLWNEGVIGSGPGRDARLAAQLIKESLDAQANPQPTEPEEEPATP